MMIETQQSISQWATESFGEPGSNFRVAARANEEVAELVRAVSPGAMPPREKIQKILEECADIWIVYCRLAERLEFDLTTIGSPIPIDGISVMEAAARTQIHSGKALYLLAINDQSPHAKYAVAHAIKFVRYIVAVFGGQLLREVERKMAINRSRQWKTDGSGHGYHVRPPLVDDVNRASRELQLSERSIG